jgi:hypothetical protein
MPIRTNWSLYWQAQSDEDATWMKPVAIAHIQHMQGAAWDQFQMLEAHDLHRASLLTFHRLAGSRGQQAS